jgi:hypothetical protein
MFHTNNNNSTSVLTFRDIPKILFENELVQDIFEMMVHVGLSNTNNTSNTNQTISIPNFNKTDLSSMISTIMKQQPYDPNGIDAQLKYSK